MNKKNFRLILIGIMLLSTMFVFSGCESKKENNVKKENSTIADNTVKKENSTIVDDNTKSNKKNSDEFVIADVKKKYEEEKAAGDVYDEKGDFLLQVEDVYTITGRGTVVTGRISRGAVKLQDEVQIIGLSKEIKTTKIIGIMQSSQQLNDAKAGEEVSLKLEGIERGEVESGQVLAKPNSIEAYKKFDAKIYMLTKEESGRKQPIYNEFQANYYFNATNLTGTLTLNENNEQIYPGNNNVKITVELEYDIAMEIGDYFTIREGGRTVAYGYVTKVYE